MKIQALFTLLFLLMSLMGCEERASLKVEKGGEQGGGSPAQESLWVSDCYTDRSGTYYRDYTQLSKFGVSILVASYSDQTDCENEFNGFISSQLSEGVKNQIVSEGWTIYEYFYGDTSVFKVEGEKLIELRQWFDYWDFVEKEFVDLDIQSEDILEYRKIDSYPEFTIGG